MANSCTLWKTPATAEVNSGPQQLGSGGRMQVLNFRSTGAAKETVAGCGATSMNGPRLISAYPSSTSTGTRPMLTAAGRGGVYRRKRNGRWRLVQSQRPQVEALQWTSARFPGVTMCLRLNAQILIGGRWDAYLLTHCLAATARSGADR